MLVLPYPTAVPCISGDWVYTRVERIPNGSSDLSPSLPWRGGVLGPVTRVGRLSEGMTDPSEGFGCIDVFKEGEWSKNHLDYDKSRC